jgi:hexosaminidase
MLSIGCTKQSQNVYKAEAVSIIPKPTKVERGGGVFILNDKTTITYLEADDTKEKAQQLAMLLGITSSKVQASTSEKNIVNSIVLQISDEGVKDKEGYVLEVSKEQIRITAPQNAGLFYGMQTLRQLLPKTYQISQSITNTVCEIPVVSIVDSPRFGWRGMMLDVSRHFFPTDSVKRFIDHLARYKFNVFHIHLTDDQGWRFQSEKFPKLTEIGAWRVDRSGNRWFDREPQQPGEKPTYGGFYTKADLKDIVAYAKSKNIEVLPEIDVPGHSRAIVASYPELGCATVPVNVAVGGIASNNTVNPGKEEVYEFLDVIFEEVAEIFPFPYIHIGGDEAIKTNWHTDPFCQKKMKEEGLHDVDELQSYFIKRVEKIVNSKDKKLIGWDEILEGGLAPDATVMSWRGVKGGIESANMGHDVVMAPNTHAYFDLFQADPKFEPDAFSRLWLKDVYNFNPLIEEIAPEKRKHILGGHGALWSEFVPNISHGEYMLFPRMLALSEVVWSENKSGWDELLTKIDAEFKRLETDGINHSKSIYNVNIVSEVDPTGKAKVRLFTQAANDSIRYTIDGSEPTVNSTLYKEPFERPNGTFMLKAAALKEGKKLNMVTHEQFNDHLALGISAILHPNTSDAANTHKLTDGIVGSKTYRDGRWLPIKRKKDVTAELLFNEPQTINKVTMNFLQDPAESVFWPVAVELLISEDGRTFVSHKKITINKEHQYTGTKTVRFDVNEENVKAVKVIAVNKGGIRAGLYREGSLYIDEIMVE